MNTRKQMLDDLTKKHTAFNSFSDMCRNNPTLRPESDCNWIQQQEIKILRNEFFGATMMEAAR